MFILLARIFNYTFNLFLNDIVSEPIIGEGLFYVFHFFILIIILEEEISFPRDFMLFIFTFFLNGRVIHF